jgi:hypothetical protein
MAANGLTQPMPDMVKQSIHFSSISSNVPLNPHAVGGQVEPVLGNKEGNETFLV